LTAADVPKIATQLTRTLYRNESLAQPLTMNSVVAAIILYQQAKTIAVDEILEDADFIFQYLMRKRAQKTTITIPPSQQSIEAQIQGLGFPMENRGKKNCTVRLEDRLNDP